MRLDQWLFENGYYESREKARREILVGHVREAESGRILDKPGQKVPKELKVELLSPPRFVSRAGDKLEAFLQESLIDLRQQVLLDVGSSTGGFTDCALQRGAKRVFAVDVGTHQLHEKLRRDPRVELFEQTDIRAFVFEALPERPTMVTVDVSFISLKKIIPVLSRHLPEAHFIFLFKPQFEVGRDKARRKAGVVYESDAEKALGDFNLFLKEEGFRVELVSKSQIKGTKGNQEYFIMAKLATQIHSLPLHVFRTYDIRGHAERELSDELFIRVGAALAKKIENFKGQEVARFRVGLARDARVSSPRLYEALKAGLKSHPKMQILFLGEVPTPMTYFANHHYGLDACFQITASHNPAEDNGLKMMIGQNTLFGDEIRELGEWAESFSLEDLSLRSPLADEDWSEQLRREYLDFLKKQFQFEKPYRIAVDTANGMSGAIAREVFEPYASDLEILFEEVDGRFPNHPADPTVPENLKDLQTLMSQKDFDVGFAYDGDGDRVGVVTRKGRILWGDEILMLLAEKVLREGPGRKIIGEVKCSQKLFKRVRELGGDPIMYKTGHSLIKKQMKETQAPIAGEMSGHMFFADRYFGFDDAIYASLRVIESMEEIGGDLDAWIESFPESFTTPEIRVPVAEEEKAARVKAVCEFFSQQMGVELNQIDGVRVGFADGSWALVRASNTQSVLVVRVEGASERRLREIKDLISEALDHKIE